MEQNIGKTLRLNCQLDPARAKALHVVLGCEGNAPQAGDPLPAFWHQIYFWDPLPEGQLGRDGHTAKGQFIPDLGLPRRMWASGALEFHAPLLIGQDAVKTSVIEDVRLKDGRSGPLGFCTVRHDISQDGQLCVTERQVLVFREDPAPDAPKPPSKQARRDEIRKVTQSFSPTTLFRYSALTLNGHRIHYDEPYAQEVEGYPGIVVHGPLLAQIMMQIAAENGELARFEWRNSAPFFAGEAGDFCAFPDCWQVRGEDGRLIAEASATYR
ncbi:MaoC family dehydratase N-terminal domain-containing protein [Thalassobius sp. I31.1]|uniref:FAS1-like dehydratase domain-containing protein n=1 Tax=Thalassobius sp. I31.1 TaxID=2109912 RepID=UPI000D1A0EAD|nr:MaoC family dehydratase N-terminal domain-containing protein [Thalassobius sp. I31.1]